MAATVFLVATTINDGRFLDGYAQALVAEGLRDDVAIIVIPDLKTPRQLYEKCSEVRSQGIDIVCPTVEEQDAFLAKLGSVRRIVPYNSDNRRNVGYLMALDRGCDILISADDDNFPRTGEAYFKDHAVVNQRVSMKAVHSADGWFNVCRLLKIEPGNAYPRGFPYQYRHGNAEVIEKEEEGVVHINVGLWLGHPDVDAVTCLYGPLHASVYKGKSFLLGQNTWSPINSQNTAVAAEAVVSYYFLRMGYPVMGLPIDRDADIFSGYFAQACARHMGYRVRVGTPVVDHIRNTHHYLKDLTHELACIWILEDLAQWLSGLKLQGNTYGETYLCLADAIEDAVEKFTGFIWTDVTRAYFHYIAYCMKAWEQAVRTIKGARA